MTIKVLAPEIASQIAAGEVIERPASVVKELIENALDAGASQISVEIEGAGQRLIEVADNGQGIQADEMVLAVERHATSKLKQADDLFRIATLGFRGEALASIGSVSRLTLTSRQADKQVGMRLVVDGGRINLPSAVGSPPGTTVRVEDLFFNVPARLKFLKQDSTERRQIDQYVTRYALAYPGVRFQVSQDGRLSLQTSGNGNQREVLSSFYGVEVAREMIQVVFDEEGMKVDGFISPTSLTRSNRRDIIFFVNGRPVQDSALSAAVIQAYHTLLMVGRYPVVVLFISLPAEDVDVNVHPTKAEVRFKNSSLVFSGLQRAVRRALLAHTPVPGFGSAHLEWDNEPSFPPGQHNWESNGSTIPSSGLDLHFEGKLDQQSSGMQPDLLATESQPILRLIGQVAKTYLAAEGPDGLYLVDQHAAHERVLFEKLMALAGDKARNGIPKQNLLQPVSITLPPGSVRILAGQLEVLSRLGFQIEEFGPGSFIIRAVPSILAHMDPSAAVRVVVEEFEEDETPLQAEIEKRIAARVCKRAAVKAGQVLSVEEQQALLANLVMCESPRTCPHGRPTMIHISVDLLERQFGRKGAR